MIDLISGTADAVYAAVAAAIPADMASVRQVVRQDAQPPLIVVGAIESENEAGKGSQLERLTVEVQCVYRGGDRGQLLAMMHAARAALDGQELSAPGVTFSAPRYVAGAVSAVGPDGVTFAGTVNFELFAEPA